MRKAVQDYEAGALRVCACESLELMASEAAAAAQAALRTALATKGRAAAIFATGNSQLRFLEKLTALHGIDWAHVTLFHMDEYLGIDDQHAASFRRYMRERFERKVHPAAFHYLKGDALEPLAECRRYAALLQAAEVDLCCMGIGENGHLAFNDPPVANFNDPERVKIVKLDEACRRQQVGEGHFPSIDAMPQYALTLTIPALLSARRIICVVPERRKAEAVYDALLKTESTACPASVLRRQSNATLYLDEDSSALVDFAKLTQF